MSEDNKNAFNEKTVVLSAPKDDSTLPPPQSGDKTVVYAQSNLKETFDARTVVRSSKPAAATLPDQAPAKVIPVDLPPPVTPQVSAASIGEAETNPDVRISSVASSDKPKLSKSERREARAALDRKTRTYMMAFGVVCVFAVAVFVVFALGGKSSDKPAVATAEGPVTETTDLASETDPAPSKNSNRDANMLGAYKTTTDVLKDFDRAAKKAQDHSVGF